METESLSCAAAAPCSTRLRTLVLDRDARFVRSLSQFVDLHRNAKVVGLGFGASPDIAALIGIDADLLLFGIDPVPMGIAGLLVDMRARGVSPHSIGLVDFNAEIYARAIGTGVLDRVMCRTDVPLLLGAELNRIAGTQGRGALP